MVMSPHKFPGMPLNNFFVCVCVFCCCCHRHHGTLIYSHITNNQFVTQLYEAFPPTAFVNPTACFSPWHHTPPPPPPPPPPPSLPFYSTKSLLSFSLFSAFPSLPQLFNLSLLIFSPLSALQLLSSQFTPPL